MGRVDPEPAPQPRPVSLMQGWLGALQQLLVHGDDAVLVTVARTEGITPREAGVKMIVTRDRAFDTVGGGALEWRAIEIGRQMLRDVTQTASRQLQRMPPDDYHGGIVTLAFERLTIADLAWVSTLVKRLAAGEASVRTVSFAGDSSASSALSSPVSLSAAEPGVVHPDCLLWDAGPLLTETIVTRRFPVMVFGAGHVGRAVIRILGTLSCQVTWVDDRPAQFSPRSGEVLPSNVMIDACDDPPSRVADAPAGSAFLVMTYSDVLDQALAEAILRRADYVYFGMIGSHAKRRAIEQAMTSHRIDPAQIARMQCPLGMDGIQDQSPEVIAVSACAALLRAREDMRL